MDNLSDVNIELTSDTIFNGAIRKNWGLAIYVILMSVILYVSIINYASSEVPVCLIVGFISSMLVTWVFVTGWKQRPTLVIDGRAARFTGRAGMDVVIAFGPHVVCDVMFDSKDESKDGWGGFRGMVLQDRTSNILITFPHMFNERDVKATWPTFIRLVRAHQMQARPMLAKVLQMGATREGSLVINRIPQFTLG